MNTINIFTISLSTLLLIIAWFSMYNTNKWHREDIRFNTLYLDKTSNL